MDAAADHTTTTTPPIPILLRRPSSASTSTTTTTTTSTSSSSSSLSSSVDFELVSMKPASYTSLRDILPSPASAFHSPKPSANSGYEISIRNRLVKQAAWAYLQPMSTFPESDGSTVFRRFWTQFSGAVLRLVTTVFDCLLQSIQVGTIAYQL